MISTRTKTSSICSVHSKCAHSQHRPNNQTKTKIVFAQIAAHWIDLSCLNAMKFGVASTDFLCVSALAMYELLHQMKLCVRFRKCAKTQKQTATATANWIWIHFVLSGYWHDRNRYTIEKVEMAKSMDPGRWMDVACQLCFSFSILSSNISWFSSPFTILALDSLDKLKMLTSDASKM